MRVVVDNWFLVIAAFAVMLFVGVKLFRFCKLPTEKQYNSLVEWLKYAVAEAERDLGSGTGTLKLRRVYEKAIKQFPWVSKLLSFDKFDQYVKDALEWLDNELTYNKSIYNYIYKKNE